LCGSAWENASIWKTQAFGKRRLLENASFACDNCGAAALSFGYDFPL
jgi:hypothetical protein